MSDNIGGFDMNTEFCAEFQLSKLIIFNVKYYKCGDNKNPYFATSGVVFQKGKRDYSRGGQCQEDILRNYKEARSFYKKWDVLHLRELTPVQYSEMKNDLNVLFEKYNFLYTEENPDKGFSFYEKKEFSKQTPKKG